MKKYVDNIKYIMRHKKNYMKACKGKKHMFWTAVFHDISKFSPSEFGAYTESFFGERDCRKCDKYLNCEYNQIGIGHSTWAKQCPDYKYKKFADAWEHHIVHNKHHWQHWIYDWDKYYNVMGARLKDCKLPTPNSIPEKYLDQIIADWTAMGIEFNNSAQQYYLLHYNEIEIEPYTRLLLEFKLDMNESMIHNYGHTLKQFKEMYDEETFDKYFGYVSEREGIDIYNTI